MGSIIFSPAQGLVKVSFEFHHLFPMALFPQRGTDFALSPSEISFAYGHLILMLTRREVLEQLKGVGVQEPSRLKIYLRDFEKYLEMNYGFKITKKEEKKSRNKEED